MTLALSPETNYYSQQITKEIGFLKHHLININNSYPSICDQMSTSVERTINFYKIELKLEDQNVDVSRVFRFLSTLPYTQNGKYLQVAGENYRSIYINSLENPIRAKLGTKRRDQLPTIEIEGSESNLDIPDGAGLLEAMHFVIFSENIIGFEFNQYAPRPSGLRNYLLKKSPSIIDDVILTPLIRHDIDALIRNIGEIKIFSFKAGRDSSDILDELNVSLANVFRTLPEMGNAKEFEIVLRNKPRSKEYFNLNFLSRLPSWLSNPNVHEQINSLKITAVDEATQEMREFDLLNEYIYSKKTVLKRDDTHRCIDSSSMYSAIITAYNELEPDIRESLERIRNV